MFHTGIILKSFSDFFFVHTWLCCTHVSCVWQFKTQHIHWIKELRECIFHWNELVFTHVTPCSYCLYCFYWLIHKCVVIISLTRIRLRAYRVDLVRTCYQCCTEKTLDRSISSELFGCTDVLVQVCCVHVFVYEATFYHHQVKSFSNKEKHLHLYIHMLMIKHKYWYLVMFLYSLFFLLWV